MTRGTRTTDKKQPGTGLAAFPATKPAGSGRAKALAPAQEYPERYFLRVMDAGFPPNFVSQIGKVWSQQELAAQAAARTNSGWIAQGGTVLMKGTPKWAAPGWMKESPKT